MIWIYIIKKAKKPEKAFKGDKHKKQFLLGINE